MKISISIYIVAVVFSKLGKTSLAFGNQLHNYDGIGKDGQSRVENSISEGEEKPLMLIIPVENIEEAELDETEKLHGRDHRRHTSCKYSRISKKFRRRTSEEDPDEYLFVLKSASEGIAVKPRKKVRKASVQKAIRLRDLSRDSRATNSEDNDSIRQRVILQPQSQDSVTFIDRELVESAGGTPKKYICSCTEEEKSPRKSVTSNVSLKNKKWPYILDQNEYRNDEVYAELPEIGKSEETVGDSTKHLSATISTDASTFPKRQSQVTDTIVPPMRIAIPFTSERGEDSVYPKMNNKWPFLRNLRKDYRSDDQASFEVVKPYFIAPNGLDQTSSVSSIRPAHDDNLPGTEESPLRETEPFKRRKGLLHREFTKSENKFAKIDKCIKLHGLGNCILVSKKSDHRERVDNVPESNRSAVDSYQRRGSNRAATLLSLPHPDGYINAHRSLDENGDDVDDLRNAVEHQLDRVHGQNPATTFQYISRVQPIRPAKDVQDYHSSSMENNNVLTLKQQRAAAKDFGRYRNVDPLMTRSASNDRLGIYSEVSRESEESDISKKVSNEYLSEYPRVWTVGESQNLQKSTSNRYRMIMAKPIEDDLWKENISEQSHDREVTNEILGQSQQEDRRIKEDESNLQHVVSALPLDRESKLLPINGTLDEFSSSHEGATSNQTLREYIDSLLRDSGINVEGANPPIIPKVLSEKVEKSLAESSRIDSAKQMSSNNVSKNPIETNLNVSVNEVPVIPPEEKILEKAGGEERRGFVEAPEKDLKMEKTLLISTEKNEQISSPTTKIRTMNVNELGSTGKSIGAAPVVDSDENIHAQSKIECQNTEHVAELPEVSATQTEKSAFSYQGRTEKADDEKSPIKYYSPTDRILAYKKKFQFLNVAPQLQNQMATDFQPAASQGNPLTLLQSPKSSGEDGATFLLGKSQIPANDDDNTAVLLNLLDENQDSKTHAFFHKNEPWRPEGRHREHSEVVENSSDFDDENFSYVDATDNYMTDPLVGSENRAWTEKFLGVTEKSTTTKSMEFQKTFNPTHERPHSETTEEFSQEINFYTPDVTDEKKNRETLGIDNFEAVRPEISTLDYNETLPRRYINQPETTKMKEKVAFVDSIRKLPDIVKSSPVQGKWEMPRGAVKNPHDHPRCQQIPDDRVSFHRDKSINYGASVGSIDRSNCTNPPYDPTYFGMLTLDTLNPVENKISDLMSTDLVYVGDGVKIPLKITRISDGSWGLTLSERICKGFVERECPCCVANGVDVVEKKKRSNEASNKKHKVESTTNQIFIDRIQSLIPNDEPNGRYTRSSLGDKVAPGSTTPAVQFAKKYNSKPDLKQFPVDPTGSSGNVGKRRKNLRNLGEADGVESSIDQPTKSSGNIDRIKSYDSREGRTRIFEYNDMDEVSERSNFVKSQERIHDTNSDEFVENRLRVKESPNLTQNPQRAALHDINEVDQETLERDESRWNSDNDVIANKLTQYGYQRNNPILQRIKSIGKKKMEQGPYRYQRNIDHDAKEKIDAATTLLHWLKNIFLNFAPTNDT